MTWSTASPASAPTATFSPSRGSSAPARLGSPSSSGTASSEVERNTATSVPMVMTRPA